MKTEEMKKFRKQKTGDGECLVGELSEEMLYYHGLHNTVDDYDATISIILQ
jgi:hypothetical protein